MTKYILNDLGEPVVENDLHKWGEWFQKSNRSVCRTAFNEGYVSTVFLGLDHNYSGIGGPVLWETMVFGGAMDQHQVRCNGNREQAEAMHQRVVDMVKASDVPASEA